MIEENVRGEDVFIVQSTSYPANDNLMETADHDRCPGAGVGAADHGGDALISAMRGRTANPARAHRSRQSSSPIS